MLDRTEYPDEIDRWHEEHPDPSTYEVAERLIPLRAARVLGSHSEDLTEITEYLHAVWIGDALTLRQAASVAIPVAHSELQKQDRMAEMKAWMQSCFFEAGLERDPAEKILREALAEQQSEGVA